MIGLGLFTSPRPLRTFDLGRDYMVPGGRFGATGDGSSSLPSDEELNHKSDHLDLEFG